MANRLRDHEQQIPPGTVSEGGVDRTTGSLTGAMAGALLGGAGGPVGFTAGALLGAAIGAMAANGREKLDHPDPWPEERERLHDYDDESGE